MLLQPSVSGIAVSLLVSGLTVDIWAHFVQGSNRRKKRNRNAQVMASAAARAYNGGLGLCPQRAGFRGKAPGQGAGSKAPLKLKPVFKAVVKLGFWDEILPYPIV